MFYTRGLAKQLICTCGPSDGEHVVGGVSGGEHRGGEHSVVVTTVWWWTSWWWTLCGGEHVGSKGCGEDRGGEHVGCEQCAAVNIVAVNIA